MSGWIRLWVLMSTIWVAIVITMATVVLVENINDVIGSHKIIYRLSKESKEFYKDLKKDEKGPTYTVSLTYQDGSTQSIRLPLVEKDIEDTKLSEILGNLAKENGKKLSNHELNTFIGNVNKKNRKAASAKAEYESEVKKVQIESLEQRKNIIVASIAALIIPPVAILLLGYGIAWVRSGFKSNA